MLYNIADNQDPVHGIEIGSELMKWMERAPGFVPCHCGITRFIFAGLAIVSIDLVLDSIALVDLGAILVMKTGELEGRAALCESFAEIVCGTFTVRVHGPPFVGIVETVAQGEEQPPKMAVLAPVWYPELDYSCVIAIAGFLHILPLSECTILRLPGIRILIFRIRHLRYRTIQGAITHRP